MSIDQQHQNALPPLPPMAGAQPTPAKSGNWFARHKIASGVIALVVVGGIASAAGGSGSETATQADSAKAPAVTQPAAESKPAAEQPKAPATEEKVEAPAAEPVVAEPKLTAGQENALDKAESYLDYSAFSKSDLIEQLKFEGFSSKDAAFAAENVEVDWMAQAVKKAQSYLEYSSFSKSGLIEQLEFEGFTSAQARHGADKAYR